MKNLIFITFLTLISISSFSQTQLNKNSFRNYQSCPSCFENWEKDNGDLTQLKSSLNAPISRTGNQVRNGSRRVIGIVITTAVSLVGLVAYNKLYSGLNQTTGIKF